MNAPPKMVYRSSVVIVTDEMAYNPVDNVLEPIVISLFTDGEGLHGNIDLASNYATSIYGRKNFANFINNNLKNGNILYASKKKSQSIFRQSGVQFPRALNSFDFDKIIKKSNRVVKTKLYDTNGRIITNKQFKLERPAKNGVSFKIG